jgi:hypothetical protein
LADVGQNLRHFAMSDILPPAVPDDHPDRHVSCQFALHAAFLQIAGRAVAAGWNEREVAAALVDLADNHMLGLISTTEVEAIVAIIKRQS